MREEILSMLYNGGFISGEEISRRLSVSRAAVAKHIKTLRDNGYIIEAVPNRGYRLAEEPDCISAGRILHYLSQAPLQTEWSIETFAELDSTSTYLRRAAERDDKPFRVAIAEMQTNGKGRLGRNWHSPAQGGLWMSLLLRPSLAPTQAHWITLGTAVAVTKAVQQLGITTQIKWPNDVLSPQGKKLCGIRCEMRADMEHIDWVVVGIGLNINNDNFPAELQETAGCLKQLNNDLPLDRNCVAAKVLQQMAELSNKLDAGMFAEIRADWLSVVTGIGKTAQISTVMGKEQGLVKGMDEDGYLIFEQNGTETRILSGDMTILV